MVSSSGEGVGEPFSVALALALAMILLLMEELSPYVRGNGSFEIAGPDLVLTSKSALALSLAIHELSTNAAKYGAFSSPAGRVAIRWSLTDAGGLRLSWTESGGPAVSVPTRRGFGSTLIERALAMETDGQATLRYLPGGLVCDVVLPPASLATANTAVLPAMIAFSNVQEEPERTGDGLRVLVIEDSFMLVSMLELVFQNLGWTMVGPATRVAKAMAMVDTERFDAVLLDVNLDGEMSWPIAAALQARGIPFVLSTGYELGDRLPDSLKGSKLVNKPYQEADLETAMLDVMKSHVTRAAG